MDNRELNRVDCRQRQIFIRDRVVDKDYLSLLNLKKFFNCEVKDVLDVNYFCQAFPVFKLGNNTYQDLHKFFKQMKVFSIILKKEKKKIGSRKGCLLYTYPSPRDRKKQQIPSSD